MVLVSAIVTIRTVYCMQPLHQVGGTILDSYLEIVFATTRILQRKADNDAFFYAFSFVWQSVALNIQPYWIWLIFYWWTLSWQSCSCSSFETIPVSLKSSAVQGMRLVRISQVSVGSIKSVVPMAGVN